ncbi:hypothetical protein [Lacunimicrobium album]
MRSVFALLRNTTEQEVRDYLDSLYEFSLGEWYLSDGKSTLLHIGFYNDAAVEIEQEKLADIFKRFGREPAVWVGVDISSRVEIENEVTTFLKGILTRFDGSALDDWSNHLWTLEVILAGQRVEGRRFGWAD